MAIRNGGAVGNVVQGNLIDTDATGTKGIAPNTGVTPVVINGVLIDGASGNTIGGTAAGTSNDIYGNTDGVFITNSGRDGEPGAGQLHRHRRHRNQAPRQPQRRREHRRRSNNTDRRNHGRGREPDFGQQLRHSARQQRYGGNLVEGNFIGTDVTGTHALATSAACAIDGAADNTIGGTTAGARNLISGNQNRRCPRSPAADRQPGQGNFIGTDVTGNGRATTVGAVLIIDGTANNTIGGTTAGPERHLRQDADVGVSITDAGRRATWSGQLHRHRRHRDQAPGQQSTAAC